MRCVTENYKFNRYLRAILDQKLPINTNLCSNIDTYDFNLNFEISRKMYFGGKIYKFY